MLNHYSTPEIDMLLCANYTLKRKKKLDEDWLKMWSIIENSAFLFPFLESWSVYVNIQNLHFVDSPNIWDFLLGHILV